MLERMTDEEFIAKVEWEGGFLDALDYGLTHKRLDPEGSEIYNIVARAVLLYSQLADLENEFYDIAERSVSRDE